MTYVTSFFLLMIPTILFAQEDYVPLEPIPRLNINVGGTEGGLTTYLNDVFIYGVGLAAVLAVLYIVWGGFKWMSTDSVSGKSEGKTIISQALLGLALVLSTYLILYTIGGPDAVRLNIGSESLRLPVHTTNEPQNSNPGISPDSPQCRDFFPPAPGRSVSVSPGHQDCCRGSGGEVTCTTPSNCSCFMPVQETQKHYNLSYTLMSPGFSCWNEALLVFSTKESCEASRESAAEGAAALGGQFDIHENCVLTDQSPKSSGKQLCN